MDEWFAGGKEGLQREIIGLLLLALSIFSFAALYGSGSGAVGQFLQYLLAGLFGTASFVAPGVLGLVGLGMLFGWQPTRKGRQLAGSLLGFLTLLTFLHRKLPLAGVVQRGWQGAGGGLVGGAISWLLLHTVGSAGRGVLIVAGALVAFVLLTGLSLKMLGSQVVAGCSQAWGRLTAWIKTFVTEPVPDDEDEGSPQDSALTSEGGQEDPVPAVPGQLPSADEEEMGLGQYVDNDLWPDDDNSNALVPTRVVHLPEAADDGADKGQRAASGGTEVAGSEGSADAAAPTQPYRRPPLSLFNTGRRLNSRGPGQAAVKQAKMLEDTLESFGVKTKVVGIQQGPAITRYELQLGRGIKVSRVQNLTNDIALSLAATDVRIEAPIPGKSAIGIEVPNREISAVALRDVLEADVFRQQKSALAVAIGEDIAGKAVVANLAALPHVLIAGATGSGKSVCISSLLASLLYRSGPDEVRLMLIDPKVVELSGYNGIPHLLVPVITDPRRAAAALQWLVREMERRYEAFAQAGARDMSTYNAALAAEGGETIPHIVVVIDELADLMLVAPVDVEDAIQRLAQMARAAGIHLVVATQRPSVDVITGVIKANIPSRIAFAVASQTDSRVILDMAGAEKLVGKGDMLFFPIGASKPVRVQGCYVSEGELAALQDYVRQLAEPDYDEGVLAAAEQTASAPQEQTDELFPEAVRLIVESGQASVSFLQRRLRVGYTRAGRLIDMMEERGFVGPHVGSRARELRLTMEEYERLFGSAEEEEEEEAAQ